MQIKKYYIELGVSLLCYMVVLAISLQFTAHHPHSQWTVWVSISPVIPALFTVLAIARAVLRMDELQQRVQLLGLVISFPIVGLTTFTYGFLQNIGYPVISFVWIFPFMVMVWGLVTTGVARYYQ